MGIRPKCPTGSMSDVRGDSRYVSHQKAIKAFLLERAKEREMEAIAGRPVACRAPQPCASCNAGGTADYLEPKTRWHIFR
jgi:hypothetical protein